MSLLDTTQQALESAMSGSMLRQTLLTNNLANVDTPGYKPEDVNFQSTLQSAIQSGQPLGQVTFQPYSVAAGTGPDGNGVSPEQQQAALSDERPAVRDPHPGGGPARVDPRERDGHGSVLMSFFDAISIAASGLTAERTRMDVTSENLANADTTQGANGQPYQRQEVVLQQVGGGFSTALAGALGTSPTGATAIDGSAAGGVQVAGIVSDPTPDQLSTTPATRPRTHRAT